MPYKECLDLFVDCGGQIKLEVGAPSDTHRACRSCVCVLPLNTIAAYGLDSAAQAGLEEYDQIRYGDSPARANSAAPQSF